MELSGRRAVAVYAALAISLVLNGFLGGMIAGRGPGHPPGDQAEREPGREPPPIPEQFLLRGLRDRWKQLPPDVAEQLKGMLKSDRESARALLDRLRDSRGDVIRELSRDEIDPAALATALDTSIAGQDALARHIRDLMVQAAPKIPAETRRAILQDLSQRFHRGPPPGMGKGPDREGHGPDDPPPGDGPGPGSDAPPAER